MAWWRDLTELSKLNSPNLLINTRDEHVPLLLMAYRTSAHDTTGVTPAKMMMGRDLRLPIDLFVGRPSEEVPVHYAQQLHNRLERIHSFAREHLQLQSDKMKEHYDSHAAGRRRCSLVPQPSAQEGYLS